jgi:hypothetical protein
MNVLRATDNFSPAPKRPASRRLSPVQQWALTRILWIQPEPGVLRYLARAEPSMIEPVRLLCHFAHCGPVQSIGGIGVDLGAGALRASYQVEVRMRAGETDACRITLWPPHAEMPAVTLSLRCSMQGDATWHIYRARTWTPKAVPGSAS